ncbi:MAG TPA: hypothetical protein VHM30_03180, partial [Gemmatimonadaceae bacterium]|nr:hypothetical protein [Gemmatimonadaceae bacterium]
MRLNASLILLAVACTTAPASRPSTTPPPPAPTPSADVAPKSPEDRFVDSLLALMTIEEKAGQLNQLSGLGDPTGPGGREAG